MSNEDRTDDSHNGSGETRDGSKSACGEVRFVPGDEEESVKVPIYDSTRHGVEQGDKEASDNVLVFEEVEWDQRVRGVSFFVHSETDHKTCAENKEDDTVGYLLVVYADTKGDLRSDHSEVGPLAIVMVTKKRPKPRTHSTRPMVSSCQNKLSA
jgi:hypothetical protein